MALVETFVLNGPAAGMKGPGVAGMDPVLPGNRHGAGRNEAAERGFASEMDSAAARMASQPGGVGAPVETGAGRLTAAHAIAASGDTANSGDAILGGLFRIRREFDTQYSRVLALQGPGSIGNTHDLIALQGEMAKLSIMFEVTSKVAGKFVTGTETLLKS
jgi:hypothetical protein